MHPVLKRTLRFLLLKLPHRLKAPLLRRLLEFPDSIPDSLRFKVAETEEELTAAYRLLHEAYVKEKLMHPHPSGMRVTKYHTLPSTTTLIALENNEVVGTVSLIRQGVFGLPCQSIFEIKDLPSGSRVAEVSSLAIKKEYLHQRGRILFPLLKFLFHYSHDYFGVSHFVIAVNPKWIDFYLSILMFKSLTQKVIDNYSFVNGAPAAGALLDLVRAPKVYYQTYHSRKQKKDLHHFFQEIDCKNMEFPLRKKGVITDPLMSPEIFHHFFIEKSSCLESMTEAELSILRELYNHPAYLQWIPAPNVLTFKKKRIGKRFETDLHGRLHHADSSSTQLAVQSVSLQGLGGSINPRTSVDLNRTHRILVNIEEMQPCELYGKFVRLDSEGSFGFSITKSCQQWQDFIQRLNSRQLPIAQEPESSETRFQWKSATK